MRNFRKFVFRSDIMSWSFCKGKSISRQIVDRVAVDVMNGSVKPSQRLPMPDEMSRITGASVNMVEKAYNELLQCGIAVRHGNLLIISPDKSCAEKVRREIAYNAAVSFIENMSEIGLSHTDTVRLLAQILLPEKHKQPLDTQAEPANENANASVHDCGNQTTPMQPETKQQEQPQYEESPLPAADDEIKDDAASDDKADADVQSEINETGETESETVFNDESDNVKGEE